MSQKVRGGKLKWKRHRANRGRKPNYSLAKTGRPKTSNK